MASITPSPSHTQITRLSRPIGAYRHTIDQPDWLQLDETGGLCLAVRVSEEQAADSRDAKTQLTLRIERLQLEVSATVQGE